MSMFDPETGYDLGSSKRIVEREGTGSGSAPPKEPADARVVTYALDALTALGGAWRGDWSDFDGRTLRDELGDWRALMEAALKGRATTGDVEGWALLYGVCIRCGSWWEHCNDRETHESEAQAARAEGESA